MHEKEKRFALIVRNLQEVVGDVELESIVQSSDNKILKVYWGTATTGRPHVAYFVPICKIADMLHAGVNVTVLFADLHAYLDNMKSPWSVLCHRATYYEIVIKAMLESVGVRLDQLRFVRGSDYQLSRAYSEDVYRIAGETSVRDARKAGAEVVKQVTNPLVSGLLYPLLQALDEEYLHVDAQFGGVDQRKIFIMCERILPRLSYRKRIHLMNPMVPGLTGGKMSASEAASKIDLLEDSASVHAKLATAACPAGQRAADGNGVLAFIKFVIFPLANLAASGSGVMVGGTIFTTFDELEDAYVSGKAAVSAEDFKECIFERLDPLMEVVRQKFKNSHFAELLSSAYPADEMSCADKHASESASFSLASKITDDRMAELKCRLSAVDSNLPALEEASLTAVAGLLSLSIDVLKPLMHRRVLRCLWSVTPVGVPHLGHTLPLRMLAELSRLPGIHLIILIDDVSAFIEGNCPWETRESRCILFQTVIRAALKAFNVEERALTIVCGHDFKCEGSYMLDLYRIVSLVPENEAAVFSGSASVPSQQQEEKEEGSGITLSTLLLPCAVLLDSYHLGADLRLSSPRFAERQERFAKQFLPHFDDSHPLPIFASHALLPALITATATTVGSVKDKTAAMTSFVPPLCDPRLAHSVSAQAAGRAAADRCIPLVEPPPPGISATSTSLVLPSLKRRLKQTFCQPGNVDTNPLLQIFKAVVLSQLVSGENLVLPRTKQHGGPIILTPDEYNSGDHCRLDDLFISGAWHPADLKAALELYLMQGLQHQLVEHLPSPFELNRLLGDAFPKPGKKGMKIVSAKPKGSDLSPKDGKMEGAVNSDEFDPSLLEVMVGEVVDVQPHPTSSDFNICRVSFGPEMRRNEQPIAVIGLPTGALVHKKAAFLTNLKPCDVAGVTSEVKVVCVGDSALLQCPNHHPGAVLRFEFIGNVGKRSKAANSRILIDPEGHPGWRAFFADIAYSADGDGALLWRQKWRLSFSPTN